MFHCDLKKIYTVSYKGIEELYSMYFFSKIVRFPIFSVMEVVQTNAIKQKNYFRLKRVNINDPYLIQNVN